ncbi:SAM-dependent methyltransferase [Rugosimonospora africana]|nr:SAM-dependent methyltransferase [Rugosimonospora africana]
MTDHEVTGHEIPSRAEDRPAARIDTTVPHPARRYDYWLGGKDNFAADRASGDAIAAAFPTIRTAAIENRRFLARAVTFLAREAGIRQFLDIGTGIPAANNTHQVAQSIAPDARVVYVDNDPIVLAHARALLASSPDGATAYIDADLRDPEKILAQPDLRSTLDLSRPVALMLIAVLHFITDDDNPRRIVTRLIDALPSGSYLAVSHATYDGVPPEMITGGSGRHGTLAMRSWSAIAEFFDGLEFVEPGLVPTAQWRDDDEPQPRPLLSDVQMYGGVARIP